MSRKTQGIIVLVLGAVLVAVGLLADTLGLGHGNGFGWKQIVVSVAGVVVAIAGAWLISRKSA